LDLDIRHYPGVCLIRIKGALKLGPGTTQLREVLDATLAGGTVNLVLNLAETPSIDSSGVGEIVGVLRLAKQAGGTVKLVSPSRFIVQSMKLLGLLNLFEVYDDEEQALQSLTS
jgi:anti-sigma B factor antagonist